MKAEEIKELRKKLKMTQTEMAEELGVDFASVNRWENEKQKPSRLAERQLKRLARKV